MAELYQRSLRQLGAALRRSEVRAAELADAALSRMSLGAYREVDPQRLRQQARAADAAFVAGYDLGPLQGIPISIKDLYGVPGFATFAGSPRPLPARYERPGPVVQAVLAQLALISGKTHTVEFAFGGIGTNPHHPTPINPWDPQSHRAPGGSTAGGGVSLCEGSAWVALGTDTAGSARIPASWTGNVGLKTTKHRWSTEGIVPLSSTLDTAGVLTRTVEDLLVVFEVLDGRAWGTGERQKLSALRFGRCDELFDDCSAGVVEAIDEALRELERAGVRIESLELPELEPAWELFRQGGPVSFELHHFLCTELPAWIERLDPNVQARIGDAARLPAHEYLARRRRMRELAAGAESRLGAVDVLVGPTVANTPPRLEDIAERESYGPQNLLSLRNTSMASYLGLCAITLPVGFDTARMPVGLQLVARANSEPRLLAIAQACEQRLGTGGQRLGTPPRCG